MKKIIEFFDQGNFRRDWKTQYIRYRIGRLKHQYWLWNRKNPHKAIIDTYDFSIIQNCQPGKTVFFGSAGHYIKDIFPEVETAELHPVVKTFYPATYIAPSRQELASVLPFRADNFAVVNNRNDLWTELENITQHCIDYTHSMNPGCRFFYSFRDTQIVNINRLTTDMEQLFYNWAHSLETICGLTLVWHQIDFKKKIPDCDGLYSQLENPDTTNGNLKFWFVYKGDPWIPKL